MAFSAITRQRHPFLQRHGRRLVVLAVLGLVLVGLGNERAGASAESPRTFTLLSTNAKIEGRSLADLSVKALRARINASKDSLGSKDCDKRPQPDVDGLFLVPGQPGKTLVCTVNRGTRLLLDFNGVICWESKKNQATPECVDKQFARIKEYRVVVDGRDLGASRYRATTDTFVVETKSGNGFGLNPGTWKLRAGGWPLVLTNLEPGEHSIVNTFQYEGEKRQTSRVTLTVL